MTPESATPAAPKYVRLKYEMCKNFKEKGVCKYGDRCLFAHGDHELVKRGQQIQSSTPSPVVELVKKDEVKESSAEESVTMATEQST